MVALQKLFYFTSLYNGIAMAYWFTIFVVHWVEINYTLRKLKSGLPIMLHSASNFYRYNIKVDWLFVLIDSNMISNTKLNNFLFKICSWSHKRAQVKVSACDRLESL